jgi:hypothetical protein
MAHCPCFHGPADAKKKKKKIASGNPDYLKIHLAGLRQMVAMRNSFADVPPDVRFQISW